MDSFVIFRHVVSPFRVYLRSLRQECVWLYYRPETQIDTDTFTDILLYFYGGTES